MKVFLALVTLSAASDSSLRVAADLIPTELEKRSSHSFPLTHDKSVISGSDLACDLV